MRSEDVVVIGESAPLRAFEGCLRAASHLRVRNVSHWDEAESLAKASRHCVLVVHSRDDRRPRWHDTHQMLLQTVEHVAVLVLWEAEARATLETDLAALVANTHTDLVRVPALWGHEHEDAGWLSEGLMRVIKLAKSWRTNDDENLFDSATGRYDAQRVAAFLRVSLRRLAEAIDANYTTVQKTPAGDALQERLGPIGRVVELLRKFHGSSDLVRQWLNTPHRELEERTPLSVILDGRADVIRDMLEAAYAGIPT